MHSEGGREGGREGGKTYLHRGSLHNTLSAPAFPRSKLTKGVLSAALQLEGAWIGTPIPAEPVSTSTSIF